MMVEWLNCRNLSVVHDHAHPLQNFSQILREILVNKHYEITCFYAVNTGASLRLTTGVVASKTHQDIDGIHTIQPQSTSVKCSLASNARLVKTIKSKIACIP